MFIFILRLLYALLVFTLLLSIVWFYLYVEFYMWYIPKSRRVYCTATVVDVFQDEFNHRRQWLHISYPVDDRNIVVVEIPVKSEPNSLSFWKFGVEVDIYFDQTSPYEFRSASDSTWLPMRYDWRSRVRYFMYGVKYLYLAFIATVICVGIVPLPGIDILSICSSLFDFAEPWLPMHLLH